MQIQNILKIALSLGLITICSLVQAGAITGGGSGVALLEALAEEEPEPCYGFEYWTGCGWIKQSTWRYSGWRIGRSFYWRV